MDCWAYQSFEVTKGNLQKCMQFRTQEQKQWFETFETPLQKIKKLKINQSPRIVGHLKVLRRGREILKNKCMQLLT